jgi:hypothetical protein
MFEIYLIFVSLRFAKLCLGPGKAWELYIAKLSNYRA